MSQQQRIEQLKQEAMRLSGGQMQTAGTEALPLDIAEQFWQRVVAFETAPTTTNFAQLTAAGVPVPPPPEVSDADIGVALWRVILALFKHRTVLERTNHLSDRALYQVLFDNVLREEITQIPEGDSGFYHVDVPGDDAEATNYLTFYADLQDRDQWRTRYPDVEIPSRQLPAYDRDGDLPAADDDNPPQEAREWLRARTNPSAIATNRFGSTGEALKFVERLYEAGASCVMVDNIMHLPQDQGGPYADELVVIYPHDARRKEIFGLIEHDGKPDTIDGEKPIVDHGRGSARLWWD